VGANFIFSLLISIVLTFNNSPDKRMIVVQFGVSDIGSLIIGAIIVLVSWVMSEASKLEDEQAYKYPTINILTFYLSFYHF
jgi:hypothetical protein